MSAAKAKGTRWERHVIDYLATRGIEAYRPRQDGFADVGDLHGVSPFILQCKDWTSWQAAIREGLDGAQRQRDAAGEAFGAAVVKRARRPAEDSYVVMRLEDFASVLVQLDKFGE